MRDWGRQVGDEPDLTAPADSHTAAGADRARPVAGAPTARDSFPRQVLVFLVEAGLAILVALVITALLRVFVFQVFQVPSGSMEQTLEQRDRIVAVRLANFSRGDIVVFQDPPSQWMGPQPGPTNPIRIGLEALHLLPDSTQGHLVKRVVGMPGDHVACCDQQDRMTINGVPLEEGSYLYTDASGRTVKPSETPFDIVVPADHIFVLGDHRDRSGDSRLHLCESTAAGVPEGMNGFVPVANVVGPVAAIVLPPGRMRIFTTPDSYSVIPPGQDPPSAPILSAGTCKPPR